MAIKVSGLFFKSNGILYSKILDSVAVMTLSLAVAVGVAHAEALPKRDLVIHVTGFKSNAGNAIASVFKEGDDVFAKPRWRVVAQIQNQQATLVFPGMLTGKYAAIVFHDENGNNDLDHNLLRMPAEPLGYSNNWEMGVFTGMPNTQKLGFDFTTSSSVVEIRVK